MLQEFLKKEFSEENILFWQACEFFSHVPESDRKQVAELHRAFLQAEKKTTSASQRNGPTDLLLFYRFSSLHIATLHSARSRRLLQLSQRAREIYNSFLSSKASTPVNIDSQAQLADDILNAPRPDMFKEQQLQVAHGRPLAQPPAPHTGLASGARRANSCVNVRAEEGGNELKRRIDFQSQLRCSRFDKSHKAGRMALTRPFV